MNEAKAKRQETEIERLTSLVGMPTAPPDLSEQLHTATEQLQRLRRGPARLYTNDSTTEKLGELLEDNPRGLVVVRDELSGLFETFHKHGREGDRQFYLEGFNAKAGYLVDRIGRGSLSVDNCLSVVGGIQPGPMQAHTIAASRGGRHADGLMQRFQLTVYPTLKPYRHVDQPKDSAAWERANSVYQILQSATPESLGAEARPSERTFILRLSPEAQACFAQWDEQHRNRIRGPEFERTPAFASHLEKYPALVGKLALVFHLADVAVGAPPGPVSLNAIELAIEWTKFLEDHARALYASELSGLPAGVGKLLDKVHDGSLTDGCSVRDMYRVAKLLKQETEPALEYLRERHWIRTERHMTGGRPTEVIRLNPQLPLLN